MAICQEIQDLAAKTCGLTADIGDALLASKNCLQTTYDSLKGFVKDETAENAQQTANTPSEGVL